MYYNKYILYVTYMSVYDKVTKMNVIMLLSDHHHHLCLE